MDEETSVPKKTSTVAPMARKRKAPSSLQTHEQKSKAIREEPVQVKEQEEPVDESSSEEEDEEPADESSSSEEEIEIEEEEEIEEPQDDASKRETLTELLLPFAKPQLIDLLKQAAATDPKILPKIAQFADSDPTHRKIFVHGLSYDATADQLLDSFAPFGEIEDSKLVTDKTTGLSKGYAFILFKNRAAARKALMVPQKQIGNRVVSCQLAAVGPPSGTLSASETGNRKLYVGNVGPHVSPEKLKSFFEMFGEVEDAPMGLDQATNKFRGFAIITFKSPEGFNKAMEEPVKVFDNCQFHCKKFVDNHNKKNVSTGSNPTAADGNYFNYGDLGANLNAGGLLMAQNPGIQLAGPAMLAAAGYNPAALAAVAGLGAPVFGNYGMLGNYGPQAALNGLGAFNNAQPLQSPVGTVGTSMRGPMGLGAPTVGDYGMLGNYGSQAASHGLGAFQNVQAGKSPVGTAGTSARGRTGGVSAQNQNTFSPYFGRE